MRYYAELQKKIKKQKIREMVLTAIGMGALLVIIYTCLIIATDHM